MGQHGKMDLLAQLFSSHHKSFIRDIDIKYPLAFETNEMVMVMARSKLIILSTILQRDAFENAKGHQFFQFTIHCRLVDSKRSLIKDAENLGRREGSMLSKKELQHSLTGRC